MDDEETKKESKEALGHPSKVADLELRLRKQKVRDKLLQLYGDNSAQTVRQFLHDLSNDAAETTEETPKTDGAEDPSA